MCRLVERIEPGTSASKPERGLVVALHRSFGRERGERLSNPLAMLVAGDQHPVVIQAGQQLSARQFDSVKRAVRRQHPLELTPVDDHIVRQTDVLAARRQRALADYGSQRRQRRTQACPGALIQYVRPQPPGDGRARVNTWMERKPAEQGPRRTPTRWSQLHPITLHHEISEYAHPQHGEPSLTAVAHA